MPYDTGLSYRRTAIEGASPIGLVIALYDTLWGDLRRAAEAVRVNNIETRCKELNHAFLVLGQLESWVAPENGGDLALSLTQFYRYLRAKMMDASLRQSTKTLEELMDLILHVRSAWQQRDMDPPPTNEIPAVVQASEAPDMGMESRRIALSFSA
jgi:flagellar secretion chaperone FliS